MTRFLILALAAMTLSSAATAQNAPRPITRSDYLKSTDNQFNGADTNHDGFISKAELLAQQQRDLDTAKANLTRNFTAQFNRLDTNHDGKLTLQEFLAGLPPLHVGVPADQMLPQLDTNHDGKVSAEEFRNSRLAVFNRLDTNHDGVVSPEEQKAAGAK